MVDALDPAEAKSGARGPWRLVFHLAAWREPGHGITRQRLRCELPAAHRDLESLFEALQPYSIVDVEAKEISKGLVKLLRIIRTGVSDAGLKAIAKELQKPVALVTPGFERLVYDRALGWYAGSALWGGKPVKVHLHCDDPADTGSVLDVATRLFRAQSKWSKRVQACALKKLLPLKNRGWLDEDEGEKPLNARTFLSRLRLSSISIWKSGRVELWHDDGGLFFGHSIKVVGDVVRGPTDAKITG